MTRSVFVLFSAWTAMLAPAVACSRNGMQGAKTSSPTDSSQTVVPVSERTQSYLALGDSYTVGTAISASGSYPVQTVSMLNKSGTGFMAPRIVAANGWTTKDLLAALDDSVQSGAIGTFDMVTLLIGVNNQYQGGSLEDYKNDFSLLLKKSISYAGNRPDHVVVISIPDWSLSAFGLGRHAAGVSAEIDQFNAANKSIAEASGVKYLNVTGYSRSIGSNDALFASDGLHYSPAEYALWAADLAKIFQAAIGNSGY